MTGDMREQEQELWIEGDAELVEKLAREADFEDETIGEYVEEAVRRRARES